VAGKWQESGRKIKGVKVKSRVSKQKSALIDLIKALLREYNLNQKSSNLSVSTYKKSFKLLI